MAWQYETGVGSDRATGYHDLLTKMVAFLTSQRVASVAINAAGTGWTTGDIATLTHAGAYLDAKFEVTASAGAITALRILAGGAFSNRAASATVSAGGTGYAVGNIIEVQGGTNREKAKFSVSTLSGSAVATVALFETGGSYSSTPSNPASTTKIGPTAGSGSGCTLTVTYTGLIGTTGLAITGAGSGATVDITLSNVGWTAERNTNSATFNSVTNEKEVVLKGDAAGLTNKPYIGFATLTATSGVNTRYAIAFLGLIAHNPATALSAQVNMLGNPGTFSTNLPYLVCTQNDAKDMDFWFSADDKRFSGVLDINSDVASDNSQYMHFYAGYYESFATEIEDPYPMFVGTSARAYNLDPSTSSSDITGLSECFNSGTSATSIWFYLSEDSAWNFISNTVNGSANSERGIGIWPMVQPSDKATSFRSDGIVADGPVSLWTGTGSTSRASTSRRLGMIPGTTPLHYPMPLTILHRSQGSPQGANTDVTDDTIRGTLANWFWVFNTNSSMATIADFSEDYITIGSDRYRVFHTHVQRQEYHFVCIKETV